jgi:D-lactate dehydrogenase
MRVTVYSVKAFEEGPLAEANATRGHDLALLVPALTPESARLAERSEAACIFVNDNAGAEALEGLTAAGVRLLALRSAGFNHVDLAVADRLGITVLRVPAYSPHAVAEHTVALMLSLNRKLHRAYARVREQNFALDGLLGFDVHGKTVGVIGTGKVGEVVCRILSGFGCKLLAFDPQPSPECEALGARYVELAELYSASDIITLHCPLNPKTHHLIDGEALRQTKRGVMIINTSRGAVIDTRTAIAGLKSGQIGSLGLDVYEEEGDLFFRNLSDTIISDDVFVRLMTFPNVLITAHQAFFTREALAGIMETTIANITAFERGEVDDANRVTLELVR